MTVIIINVASVFMSLGKIVIQRINFTKLTSQLSALKQHETASIKAHTAKQKIFS